jgi:hypothetical protein
MAANDMTDALEHPHPNVPFAMIGGDTITAIAQQAIILKFPKAFSTRNHTSTY